MNEKWLLFVEDREDQQILLRDAVNDWNERHEDAGRRFVPKFRSDFAAGLDALVRMRIDGALVDLRLPESGGGSDDEPIGRQLADTALRGSGIPVAIITALETDLGPDFPPSDIVELFNKGDRDVFARVVEWFAERWTMMEVLQEARARIRGLSAEVFTDRLWKRWSSYMQLAGDDAAVLIPIVSRQFVWHMGEVLGLGGETDEKWHPFENWLCPPLQPDRAHTGDVFDLDGELWIVLTPPCDMANDGRVSRVLLARCDRDGLPQWDEMLEKLRNASDEAQRERFRGWFRKLVNQSRPSEHFLPPLPGDGRPLLVRFAEVETRPFDELQSRLGDRTASVSAPFLGNLTQRFGAYVSRMGQPNIGVDHFLD